MPAEVDPAAIRELSDRWWDASASYRENPHWLRASATLAAGDTRLLLLGPGKENALHEITLGLKEFLDRAGFSPAILDGDLDLPEHRKQASDYPRIVALPITVGSCAEVLDFSAQPHLRELLAVVLPSEHRGGYFARVIEEQELKIRECGSVGEEIDDSLGKKCLMALAGPLARRESAEEADAWTDRAPPEENAPAREGRGRAGDLGEHPRLSPLAMGFFGFGALAIIALVVLAIAASPWVLIFLVLIVIVIVVVVLTGEDKLSETNLVKIFQEIIKQLPRPNILGRRNQKQLPPPGSNDASSAEEED
jgi:hypothetical protein